MAKEKVSKAPTVCSTVLLFDKECKSCIRYRTVYDDEDVTTSLYLLKESYKTLGEPQKITVSVQVATNIPEEEKAPV